MCNVCGLSLSLIPGQTAVFDHILFTFVAFIIWKLRTHTHTPAHTHINRQSLITAAHVVHCIPLVLFIYLIAHDLCENYLPLQTHTRQDAHTARHTVRHRIYDSSTAVPRGYWTFSSVINVSVLIDDLYCNYLLKGRNRIIRKGLEGRKVLIQWEFWGGNRNAEGDKVHGSPQNSVSANGEEEVGGGICRKNQWSELMAY